MLQCLNKKDKMIENSILYTVLVKYALFCCTVPRVFTEDKEGPDVLYKDGLNTGNKHYE